MSIDVPTLSELRASAGQTSIPLDVIERIEKMIFDGELPITDGICPLTQRPANLTIFLHVECERARVVGGEPSGLRMTILTLVFGWWVWLPNTLQKPKPEEEHGRDRSVVLPIRLSHEGLQELSQLRQGKLRLLLNAIPIYSELLQEYPEAIVSYSETDSRNQSAG